MTWTAHVTVAAIAEVDGRFLMVEEQTEDDGIVLNQPAGHLEPGESLLDAVTRETLEETARAFTPRGIVGIYQWRVPPEGKTFLRCCFHGDCGEQRTNQPLDTDILRALWMTPEELAAQKMRLRSPLVMQCLDDYLLGITHPLELIRYLNHD
ncbi:MAG: NUDIX hydrolase [Gammaproteobacteria bacterium]|nr:NUDIX hydrolase [Gammaproteobacteria bacterium]